MGLLVKKKKETVEKDSLFLLRNYFITRETN